MQSKITPFKSNVCKSRRKTRLSSAPGYILLFLLMLLASFGAAAQVPIVYYDFEDNASRNSIPLIQGEPELSLAGVNPSTITRVGSGSIGSGDGAGEALSGSVTGATAGIALSSSNWPTVNPDPGTGATDYYQFSLSTIGLADLGINMDIKSTNGPERWGMLFSLDNGATFNIVQSTGGAKNVTGTYQRLVLKFDGAAVFNNHPNLIFRIYAYKGGTATTGTFEIDNLTILAKTITSSKTLLDEAHIYTCITSGATGGLTIRDGLKVSGAGTVATMSSGLVLAGSLEMDGGTLEVGAHNLTLNCPAVTGTTAETGIITTTASGITIGGKETETTSLLPALKLPANITQLNSLTINRTNGATLDNNLVLNGTLNLTSGNLTTSATKKVTIASTGAITGGNDDSFVNGPMSLIIADNVRVTKAFPVGKGTAFRPVTLTLTQDSAIPTEYTAEQIEGGYSGLIMTTDSLDNVSGIRHFSISKGGGATVTDAEITLTYGNDDQVDQPEALRVAMANYNNTRWIDLGRDATVSGTGATGTITSDINFSSFGRFALGNAKGGFNSLPVELVRFNAVKKGASVILDWATASEENNKGFDVQVSSGSSEFRTLGFVASKSTNGAAPEYYNYTDTEPGKQGTRYYRLKQTDLDGTVTYSPVKAVTFAAHETAGLAVYPNPFKQKLTLEIPAASDQTAIVEITDALGKVVDVQELELTEGINQETVHLPPSLALGIYTLALKTSENISYQKIIKK